MPYFLDFDFYSQTSSAKSAIVSNALLPVPAHLETWRDRFSTLFLYLTNHGECLSEEVIDIHDLKGIALSLVQDMHFNVGVFESDDLPNSSEEEVIPSSYPESDSSSQFYLGSELIKTLGERVKDGNIFDCETSSLETFVQTKHDEGCKQLEVPIMCNAFSQALSKLLVTKTLLKRLQVLPADDPLLKPDKTPWKDSDFFEDSHQQQHFEVPSFHEGMIEEFHNCSLDKVHLEELLMPVVKSSDRHLLVDNFHNLNTVKEQLDSKQQSYAFDCIAEVNIECLNFGNLNVEPFGNLDLSSVPTENIKPPLEFSKEGTPERNLCNDLVIERSESPVFGFPMVSAPQRPKSVLNYFSDSCWKENLDPFKGGDISEACCFLTKKEYKKLKLELWESERHFDEERLQEPILPKPDLPHLFGAAKQLFSLTPEMDSLPYHKSNVESEFYKQFRCMEDPSKEVVSIGSDLKLPKPMPVEKFTKTFVPYKDWWSDEVVNEGNAKFISSSPVDLKKGPAHENRQLEDHQQVCFIGKDNPLEFFMQFRSHSTQMCSGPEINALPKITTKQEFGELEKRNQIVSSSNEAIVHEHKVGDESVCGAKSNIIKVPFAGPHEEVLKCLEDFMVSHFDKVKQKGLIPHHQTFYATSIDNIRFLMKENNVQHQPSQKLGANEPWTDTPDLTQSLNILLRIRQALHLLIHSCLPSAVHHIASFNNSLEGNGPFPLQERLQQFHCSFHQQNILHPKLDTLVKHLTKMDHHKTTTLILVQQGLMSLVSNLERVLTERAFHDVKFVKKLEDANVQNFHASRIVISFEASFTQKVLESFDQIIQFDASQSTMVKDLCKEMGMWYMGLISDYSSKSDDTVVAKSDKLCPKLKSPFTVIGSVQMMQHRQLVYTLEARHNIMFIERNYTSFQSSQPVHHADIIFSLEMSLVLLPLLVMGTRDWDMEEFTKRVIAVGLQTQQCFILVHGIGAPSKYPLDKIVLQNLYQLRSCLSNLSRSSSSFVVEYKVLVALTQEDVTLNIVAIARYSASLILYDEDKRRWLQADITKDEAFLLQLVCLNSFSAQLLLSKLSLEDILTMSPKQIKESFPHFPDTILMYFHHITSKLKSDQISSSSNSSQVSVRSTSQKSACSSSSNPISDLSNGPLSPTSLHLPSQRRESVSSSPLVNIGYEGHRTSNNSDRNSHSDANYAITMKKNERYNNSQNNISGVSNRDIAKDISKTPHNRGVEDGVVDISSQINGDLTHAERRKRISLNCKEKSCPPKKVCNVLDSANYSEHLVMGGRTTQARPSKSDNRFEMFDNVNVKREGMIKHRIRTRGLDVTNTDNMVEVCCHPNTNTSPCVNREVNSIHQPTKAKCVTDKDNATRIHKNENYNLPILVKQENLSIFQQNKDMNDDDDSQEMFFLGKSQNSPQQTYVSENSDKDDDTSIVLVKSQEAQLLPQNTKAPANLHGTDIVTSILSDQHHFTYPNTSYSTSCSSAEYERPLSLSVVKPLTVSSDFSTRWNCPSNKPTSSLQNNTPSNTKYGIFSAKVGRKVEPMPAPVADVNHDTSIHDNQNICLNQSVLPESSCLYSTPANLPDVTQLPFSVSWDLRKHIKQSNSKLIGKNNKFLDGSMEGAVYGERISRVPFVLRGKDITQDSIPNALHSANSPQSREISHGYDRNQLSHNDTTNKFNVEPQHQNFRRSDSCAKDRREEIEYELNSRKPSRRYVYNEKENNHCTTNEDSDVSNKHCSRSFVNYPVHGKENQPQSNFSDLGDRNNFETKYYLSNYETRGKNATRQNEPRYFEPRCKSSFSCFGEVSKQPEINELEYLQHLNDTNHDINQRTHSQSNDFIYSNIGLINHEKNQSCDVNSNSRHPVFERVDSNHIPSQEFGRQTRTQDTRHSTKNNDGIYTNVSSLRHETNISSNLQNIQNRHCDGVSRNNRVIDCEKQNPVLHGNTDGYRTRDRRRGYIDVQEDRTSLKETNSSVSNYRDKDHDGFPPQPHPTNVMRMYNLPYTPRRNISVGLAQPLQRSQENLINHPSSHRNRQCESDTFPQPASRNHPPIYDHHHQEQQWLSQLPQPNLTGHARSPSPPMDLVNTWDKECGGQYIDTAPHAVNKMKRWKSHLQKHVARFAYPRDQHDPDRVDSPPRQKRLCMEKGGDTNGQMVLVFK